MAGRAGDQALPLVPRVACRVGIGLVLRPDPLVQQSVQWSSPPASPGPKPAVRMAPTAVPLTFFSVGRAGVSPSAVQPWSSSAPTWRRRAAMATSAARPAPRSEEHTSELQSLMRISYAVFCLKKKTQQIQIITIYNQNHNQ